MIERQEDRLHAREPVDVEQKAPDRVGRLRRIAHRLDHEDMAGRDAALEHRIDAIERIGRRLAARSPSTAQRSAPPPRRRHGMIDQHPVLPPGRRCARTCRASRAPRARRSARPAARPRRAARAAPRPARRSAQTAPRARAAHRSRPPSRPCRSRTGRRSCLRSPTAPRPLRRARARRRSATASSRADSRAGDASAARPTTVTPAAFTCPPGTVRSNGNAPEPATDLRRRRSPHARAAARSTRAKCLIASPDGGSCPK